MYILLTELLPSVCISFFIFAIVIVFCFCRVSVSLSCGSSVQLFGLLTVFVVCSFGSSRESPSEFLRFFAATRLYKIKSWRDVWKSFARRAKANPSFTKSA